MPGEEGDAWRILVSFVRRGARGPLCPSPPCLPQTRCDGEMPFSQELTQS